MCTGNAENPNTTCMPSVTVKVSFSEALLPFSFEYQNAETKQKEI